MSVLKFMSSRITSGLRLSTVRISDTGEGSVSTRSKHPPNSIFSASRIP